MQQGVSLGAPHSVTLNRHQAGELRIAAKEQKNKKSRGSDYTSWLQRTLCSQVPSILCRSSPAKSENAGQRAAASPKESHTKPYDQL